jgi:hypothetical protein
MVNAAEVGQKIQPMSIAVRERIEYPDLDMRMLIERYQQRIRSLQANIIQQQADAHSTVCGAQERRSHEVAAIVCME